MAFFAAAFSAAVRVGYRPILLKKSDAVFTTEEYAHEIEILNGRTSTRTKILRSSAQNRLLH
jgi:hypothetical protein